ncbi:choloylglycine hydrolase family protein [Blastopirellula sp. JC732]|uniref:Choloylglycine hydrolase family protein n=1 Tax=Blastopirellula sediminis TaxID=2894196 RepID=A0A9X1MLP9_9BACT|nr:choloylglycine hydrolase family protein [Blastopirellula sediminis]MCC9608658.1 choloylglycine hydrolase family protein [Blastopirellula sediminis]MCC9628565.1 choloylglycine hydrolase family protein [Blastopirellula sediminis]
MKTQFRTFARVGIVATLLMTLIAQPLSACTGLRLISADGGTVIGRTMEFGFDLQSKALVVPAGVRLRNTLTDPSQGMSYDAKYGFVGANVLGFEMIVDGVNDQGLYVGSFYFPGYAGYATLGPDNQDRALAPEDYGMWLLANCATVAEVKQRYNEVVLVDRPIEQLGGKNFDGHFVVHDHTGASVVIEPIDGGLRIYDNPLGVITNSPTFDWHMTNLRNYINLSVSNVPAVKMEDIQLSGFGQGSGLHGLPGDSTPPSRFVRAVAYSQAANQLKTTEETVNQVFHLMNAFDIPVGSIREKDGSTVTEDYTLWTTVSDLKNVRWLFRTYGDQTIRCIDVRKATKEAGDKIQVIEMKSTQPIADISTDFS